MRLADIVSPSCLKGLTVKEMEGLAAGLRSVIIDRVSKNGGHLASNLGAIEIAISLHRVFDSPADKIIWDVGHQSYAHKLLTGRGKDFPAIRKLNGISGFPRRSESGHDPFGTGHSSTSISAALGISAARDLNRDHFKVVAVTGDGALTAGLAFEGLNNAGALKKDLIIILNDNEMSISRSTGALSVHLNKLFKRPLDRRFIFDELGLKYIGPVDGHDIGALIEALEAAKRATGPVVLHAMTQKGKGYKPAEDNPSAFHGVGPFDPATGASARRGAPTYSEVFGRALTELAGRDERIVAITAAMKEGTGLERFAEKYPERFFDVGIAEPHAVTFAAGLATQGLRPVVAVYSTFLQRAYDQIVHDVCLQNLPMVFALDRAGIVGEDGPTHNGLFDLSYLRHIPNLAVMAPKDASELGQMLSLALTLDCPAAIRYPRGSANSPSKTDTPFALGESEILRYGEDIAIFALGNAVEGALSASVMLEKAGLSATIVNARFVKPMDTRLLDIAKRIKRVITVEENASAGGFGSALLEALNASDIQGIRLRRLGAPDEFIEHGRQDELRRRYMLDKDGIYAATMELIREGACTYQ